LAEVITPVGKRSKRKSPLHRNRSFEAHQAIDKDRNISSDQDRRTQLGDNRGDNGWIIS
jgi:hypothetical protein